MIRGFLFHPHFRFPRVGLGLVILLLSALSLPLLADISIGGAPANNEDFGQYLVDHQDDLAPFYTKNAGDMVKLAVPLLMSMLGWVIIFTMLLGWGVDVLMSRGFAFFFAPAYGDWKRSIVYATGRLFLSFLYTCLISLAIVLSLGWAQALTIISVVVLLLVLVAFAAQIVWILYLYRTGFGLSIAFYIVLAVVHVIAGVLLTQPIMGSRAPAMATNFIDRAITPRLQAEADSTRAEYVKVKSSTDAVQARVVDLQGQIAQSQAEQDRLRREIEEKKNSDIYILAQIVKARATGDLASAHEQLVAFPTRFPTSPLDALAGMQLSQVNDQMAVELAQKKQRDADEARAQAAARADLLARAAKGEVTLSEMRQALIGKTRAQVSDLLGTPSETASDTWGYSRQMIVNPQTNEKHGLTVNFSVGIVQGVDYDRNGGTP
jgi:DNA-binding transcriptional regulator YdaS (Cro superfamily)